MRSHAARATARAMITTKATNTVVPIAPSRLPLLTRCSASTAAASPDAVPAARSISPMSSTNTRPIAMTVWPGALLEQVGQVEQAREGAARVEHGEQRRTARAGRAAPAASRGRRCAGSAGRRGRPRRSSSWWCRCRSRRRARRRAGALGGRDGVGSRAAGGVRRTAGRRTPAWVSVWVEPGSSGAGPGSVGGTAPPSGVRWAAIRCSRSRAGRGRGRPSGPR